jgi:pilus assembly protein CpaF
VARNGTTVAIRKFSPDKLTVGDMIARGSMTAEVARFLEGAVRARLNIVVAGGTGSGKTSLLNALATFIPADERILTIEDSAELQLRKPHVVAFESRPPDRNGKGAIDMGELLHSALRLRPDRIVVGEVRGGECFHLLQAMNTGHGGSLATVHANSPLDTLHRLESLCLLSGVELPLIAVRAQVASAIGLVVCCARLADGSRKVTAVGEVLPLDERGEHRVQELWKFVSSGRAEDGTVLGRLTAVGTSPRLWQKLEAAGFTDGERTQVGHHPLEDGSRT